MGNPSTIWTQLSMPNPPAGSIPFVDVDNLTIITDVANLKYDATRKALFVRAIEPIAALGCTLGTAQAPFDGAFFTYLNNVTTPAGGSGIVGTFNISYGATSVVVTNARVGVNSKIFIQQKTYGAAQTAIKSIVCAAGSFTVTIVGAQPDAGGALYDYFIINPA